MSEDLPEEWVDCRKILKPVFNAAKQIEKYKFKTHLSKDRLIIDGHIFTTDDIQDANMLQYLPSTCQRSDDDKAVFLGLHSVFSNMFPCEYTIENTKYNSAEQFIQSERLHYSMTMLHSTK